jgi:Domain of unknown function (DUF6431)
MQMLHRIVASIQHYVHDIRSRSAAARYRPQHCPMCGTRHPLRAHGFYTRTLVDVKFDGSIPVRRYLCLLCRCTVSLLPQVTLPYLRFAIVIVGAFLVGRLLKRRTLREAAREAWQPQMPYQRGQSWVRRFRAQAAALCLALTSLTAVAREADFVKRALCMLEAVSWIVAHCFLFAELRMHLLGWPPFLAPRGCRVSFSPSLPGT